MDLIQAPYIPANLDIVEKNFVFDYYSLKSALYSAENTNFFPHFFTESDSHYSAPIFHDRIVQTPEHGMRLIMNASILIRPMYGFNANGIWNHALATSPNIVIPA